MLLANLQKDKKYLLTKLFLRNMSLITLSIGVIMKGITLCAAIAFCFFTNLGFSQEHINSPLDRLKEGNARYVSSTTVCHEDWTAKRTALTEGQKPFAIIVACSDSRVPPEVIFDQSLGDLFVVRVAGNVVDDFAIGSIEYGASVLGAKLIVVLGHANCGAVDAAVQGMSFNNHIAEVVKAIRPAARSTRNEKENRLEKTIKVNIQNVAQTLSRSRPTLAPLIQQGNLSVVGAYYSLQTGEVEFIID